MAITCNFGEEESGGAKADKILTRIPAAQDIGADTPDLKLSRHGAYLWNLTQRRRGGKSWRDKTSIN